MHIPRPRNFLLLRHYVRACFPLLSSSVERSFSPPPLLFPALFFSVLSKRKNIIREKSWSLPSLTRCRCCFFFFTVFSFGGAIFLPLLNTGFPNASLALRARSVVAQRLLYDPQSCSPSASFEVSFFLFFKTSDIADTTLKSPLPRISPSLFCSLKDPSAGPTPRVLPIRNQASLSFAVRTRCIYPLPFPLQMPALHAF